MPGELSGVEYFPSQPRLIFLQWWFYSNFSLLSICWKYYQAIQRHKILEKQPKPDIQYNLSYHSNQIWGISFTKTVSLHVFENGKP